MVPGREQLCRVLGSVQWQGQGSMPRPHGWAQRVWEPAREVGLSMLPQGDDRLLAWRPRARVACIVIRITFLLVENRVDNSFQLLRQQPRLSPKYALAELEV